MEVEPVTSLPAWLTLSEMKTAIGAPADLGAHQPVVSLTKWKRETQMLFRFHSQGQGQSTSAAQTKQLSPWSWIH